MKKGANRTSQDVSFKQFFLCMDEKNKIPKATNHCRNKKFLRRAPVACVRTVSSVRFSLQGRN